MAKKFVLSHFFCLDLFLKHHNLKGKCFVFPDIQMNFTLTADACLNAFYFNSPQWLFNLIGIVIKVVNKTLNDTDLWF